MSHMSDIYRPKVTAAIVTFNKRDAVIRLLERLDALGIPAFVTENASSDGTADALSGRFSNVSVLKSDHNLGGTGGFNCALLAALSTGSDYIVLLDDDVLPDEGCIDTLAAFLDDRPEYAFAAPAIYISSSPDTVQETGGGVDFSRLMPVEAWNRFRVDPELADVIDIDYASACCLMVRAEAIRKIGVMDWNYFIFSDDVDWSLRLGRSAGKAACVTTARAVHDFPWAKPFSPMRLYFFQRNGLYMISKLRNGRKSFISLFSALVKMLKDLINSRATGDREIFNTLKAAFIDSFSGKMGKWENPVSFGTGRKVLDRLWFEEQDIRRILVDITIEDVDEEILSALSAVGVTEKVEILCDPHRTGIYESRGLFSRVFGRRPGRLGLLRTFLAMRRNRYDLVITDTVMSPRRPTAMAGRFCACYHGGRLFSADRRPFAAALSFLVAPFVAALVSLFIIPRYTRPSRPGRPSPDAKALLKQIHVDPALGQPWARTLPSPVPEHRSEALSFSFCWRVRQFFLRRCLRVIDSLKPVIPGKLASSMGYYLHGHLVFPPVAPPRLGPGEESGGFREWCELKEQYAHLQYRVRHRGGAPLFSVLVPVCDPSPDWLTACVDSVRSQTYSGWELILSDDASEDPGIRDLLTGFKKSDSRIKVRYSGKRSGIARTTNSAAEEASAPYLLFLDHDDLIPPHALAAFAEKIAKTGKEGSPASILYGDEDRFDHNGTRMHPGFKPGYSPDTLLATNYIHHPVVMKRGLFDSLGGLNPEFDGSQDHDLLLRAVETNCTIAHIPDILYHMRLHEGSLASGPLAKPHAHKRDQSLIEETLVRRNISGRVDPSVCNFPGFNRIIRDNEKNLPVSVLIPLPGEAGRQELLERWQGCECLFAPSYDPSLLNRLAQEATGEVLIIAHGHLKPGAGWKDALLPHLLRREIGLVTGKLIYDDGRLHSCGLVGGVAGAFGRWHFGCEVSERGYGGWMALDHEVWAVPGEFMAIRKELFLDSGMFDTAFTQRGFEIDLALRLQRDFPVRHLVVPGCSLCFEGGFPGQELERWYKEDFRRLWSLWGSELLKGDPYLNPNLSLMNENVNFVGQRENSLRGAGAFGAFDTVTTDFLGERFPGRLHGQS